jgi:conjugal transfer ATP-binding protein TraC
MNFKKEQKGRFNKASFRKIAQKIKKFITPNELLEYNQGLTTEQLKALSERSTISKMIFHRYYFENEIKGSEPIGLYRMGDGRFGCIFEITPPPYLSEAVENNIISVLSLIVKDDTIVYINGFGSTNIQNHIESYTENHRIDKKINLKNPQMLEDFVENKTNYLNRWRDESIMGKDSDLRVRDIRNTISILFPYDMDQLLLEEQYFQILGVLKSMGGRKLPANEFIPLIEEFINPERGKYPVSNDSMSKINVQLTKGAAVRLDDDSGIMYFGEKESWKAKVLTTDKYPPSVDLFTMQNAFFDVMGNDIQSNIPGPFMATLTIRFNEIEKRRKEALSKARHNYKHTASLGVKLEKIFPDIKTLKDESAAVIDWITQAGEIPLDAKYDIIIWEKEISKLNLSVGALKKSFEQIPGRWILKEESFSQIAFQIFLQSIPLNYSQMFQDNIKKMDMTFKANNAQIAPLINGFGGIIRKHPTHLYIDRLGKIVPIDYFASNENYNVVIIGPQGSGKSVFSNDFQYNGLTASWDIRMIDFGRTYERMSNDIGGEFLEFVSNNEKCLNFFTYINTKTIIVHNEEREVIHEDEFETIIPVVGLMMGVQLRDIQGQKETQKDKMILTVMASYVKRAVEMAFKIDQRGAGMKQVRESLISFRDELSETKEKIEKNLPHINLLNDMIVALENYALPRGLYYKYYNGTNNVNITAKHFIAELDDIADSPVMPVIVMGLLQRMAQEAFIGYLKDKKTSRVIGVDEAWRVLDKPIFASFLEDFARRIRKYNGITLIITQRVGDFYKHENSAAQTIYETASFKVFLPQGSEAIDIAIAKKHLVLNRFQTELMRSLKKKTPHYNEFMIKYGDAVFIGLLKLNPDDYWTFTSNPRDRAMIDDVINSRNYSLSDAVWYMARKSEGLKEEEIQYRMQLRSKKNKETVDWDDFFANILDNNGIKIAKQFIYDVETQDIAGKELLIRATYKGNIYSSAFFKDKAKERGVYLDIAKIFIDRCFEYARASDIKDARITINIDIDEIKNEKFSKQLLQNIDLLEDELKTRLIFDVVLDYNTKDNLNSLLSFALELKKRGVEIALDNIDFGYLDIKTLIQLNPSEFKINVDDLKDFMKDEISRNHIKSLIFSLLNFSGNAKTVLVKIESKEDEEIAREFNIKYVQGYKYGQLQII